MGSSLTPRGTWVLSAVAVAIVVVALVLATQGRQPAGSGPSPSGSPVGSAEASPTATVASPSEEPSPSALATPAPSTGAQTGGTWQLVATFGEGVERPTFVYDATAWADGFVAVGIRLDQRVGDVGPFGGPQLLWTSADGIGWEERPLGIPAPPFQERMGLIEHIAARPDGSLLVVMGPVGPARAWASADAVTWTEVALGIGDVFVRSLASGDRGMVLVAATAEGAQQVWFSPDGVSWQLTHAMMAEEEAQLEAAAAGPEGFVVVGALVGGTDQPHVIVSSDGVTWSAAPDQPSLAADGFPVDVAPLGSDWVATGFGEVEGAGRSPVWRSTDGLSWTRDVSPTDPAGRETYYATDIAGDGGHVILSPAEFCLCGQFQDPTVAWSTTDGVTWAALDPDGGYVVEVAQRDATVVAVGRIGRGDAAAFWKLVEP